MDFPPDKFERLKQRLYDEPLVPIGCLLTAGILAGGIVSFRQGNRQLSQKFMRARVVAQMATLCAVGYGAYNFSTSRPKSKTLLEEHLNLDIGTQNPPQLTQAK